jgi:hypothetical protein
MQTALIGPTPSAENASQINGPRRISGAAPFKSQGAADPLAMNRGPLGMKGMTGEFRGSN